METEGDDQDGAGEDGILDRREIEIVCAGDTVNEKISN
jgi:hypothetical protein